MSIERLAATALPRPKLKLSLDTLAWAALVTLALFFGLGDIAQVSTAGALVLNGVHGVLLIAIALALVNALYERQLPAFPSTVALPAAAWLAALAASAAFATTHRTEAIATLQRPACGVLLAWAVWQLCRSPDHWLRLLRVLALGGLAIGLVALAEASGEPDIRAWLAALHGGAIPIGDVPRVASTLSHPNEAAMLLELSLPLLIGWAWTTAPRWRPALVAAAAGTLLAIVLTFSRAGITAAALSLVAMAALCGVHRERRKLLLLGLTALVLPLALLWAWQADPGLDQRLTAGIMVRSSPGPPARIEFWSAAVEMLRDHPWLGVGPDNFRWQFASYSGVTASHVGIHAHNQYLETLADTGLVGMLAFMWMLVALVRVAIDRVRRAGSDWPWRVALLTSLSGWLLHALLDDFERFWPTSVAFWLIAGLSLMASPQRSVKRR